MLEFAPPLEDVLEKRTALEPITVVQVVWENTNAVWYATRDLPEQNILGKILTVSDLQLSLNLSRNRIAQATIQIDDTDGSIKNIIDNVLIHKQQVNIYQHFRTLDWNNKLLLFSGQIVTPINWSESDRTVTLTITSEVESYEVGFSPEEGQFEFVSTEAVGKAWPLCFGKVKHVPAVKIKQVKSTTLFEDFGIVDATLQSKLEATLAAYNQEAFFFYYWQLVIQAAESFSRPIPELTNEFISIVRKSRQQVADWAAALQDLDDERDLAQRKPDIPEGILDLDEKEEAFRLEAEKFAEFNSRVFAFRQEFENARFEFQTQNDAARKVVEAYNEMRRLKGKYFELLTRICTEKLYVKSTVLIDENHDFGPDPIDVFIHGLRFRVRITGEKMEILSNPKPAYTNLEVDSWTPDPEPCTDIVELDGIDSFRLKEFTNVEGQYLLVTDKTTNLHHILHVRRQVGERIYFDLVEWDTTQAQNLPASAPLQQDWYFPEGNKYIFTNQSAQAVMQFNNLNDSIEETAYKTALLQLGVPINYEEDEILRELSVMLPNDQAANFVVMLDPNPEDIYTIVGKHVKHIVEVAQVILPNWLNRAIPYEEIPTSGEWRASSGETVSDADDRCELYVANIIPSTIRSVQAYRTGTTGKRFLASVPSRYYEKRENEPLGPMNLTIIAMEQPLVDYIGENWEDQIYVSLESSVGPNSMEVIEWITDTFIPEYSFIRNDVMNYVIEYPTHFALLEKVDALTEILRIAYESRVGLTLSQKQIKPIYLPEQKAPILTIDESLCLGKEQSPQLQTTQTERLITLTDNTYKRDYLPRDRQLRYVIRHNIKRFGLHKKEEFYHTFKHKSLVEKSATFWLMREANSWKYARVKLPFHYLNLEVYDFVTLSFDEPYFANQDIIGQVEEVRINPNNYTIDVLIQTAVRQGEMYSYPFFWPKSISGFLSFPTDADIQEGYAGSYGPYVGVTGTIKC